MKDSFKFQVKSNNLTRLQDLFVNDTKENFRTNYTITNKSVKGKEINYDFVPENANGNQTPTFIKKYNKVLNDFFTPQGPNFITVDLDEKLKLNFLQSQIENKKSVQKDCYKSQLEDLKIKYLIGSPIRSNRTEVNFNISTSPKSLSPRSINLQNKNRFQNNEIVQSTNTFFYEERDKKTSFLSGGLNNIQSLNSSSNEYFHKQSPVISKANFNKKEIIKILDKGDDSQKPLIERIQQFKFAKSHEKDLRKRVILTSKFYIY